MRTRHPRLPAGFVPPPRIRYRRVSGAPYVADVVERARQLVEGTSLPEAEIARRIGIGVATVHGWKVRRRWLRPQDASVSTRKVGVHRSGFTRRFREALIRLEELAAREADRLGGAACQELVQESVQEASLRRARALVEAARRARRARWPSPARESVGTATSRARRPLVEGDASR